MSQDAINASAQNAVVAINNAGKYITSISESLATIALSQQGATNSALLSYPVGVPYQFLVYTGFGRIAQISVISAGTTNGYIYDSATVDGAFVPPAAPANATAAIAAIPNTIGIFDIQMAFTTGIIIQPGTGQKLVISYTAG